MPTFTVLAINIGQARRISLGDTQIDTGIFKTSVSAAVAVNLDGIAGDTVCDQARHGGPDQAVYLYSAEDIAWWASRLKREIAPGYFGENITVDRWWSEPRIGDRLTLDQVELEISFPRIPCATLAARVGNPKFLKEFVAANRPGLYARVIHPGLLRVGSEGVVCRAPETYPTAEALFACWHAAPRDPNFLRSSLLAPIAHRARAAFERWLS